MRKTKQLDDDYPDCSIWAGNDLWEREFDEVQHIRRTYARRERRHSVAMTLVVMLGTMVLMCSLELAMARRAADTERQTTPLDRGRKTELETDLAQPEIEHYELYKDTQALLERRFDGLSLQEVKKLAEYHYGNNYVLEYAADGKMTELDDASRSLRDGFEAAANTGGVYKVRRKSMD